MSLLTEVRSLGTGWFKGEEDKFDSGCIQLEGSGDDYPLCMEMNWHLQQD